MGLGKSLTIIALIAHNQKELDVKLENGPITVLHPIKTTLIVAPLGRKPSRFSLPPNSHSDCNSSPNLECSIREVTHSTL
jgi:hypothetical protein